MKQDEGATTTSSSSSSTTTASAVYSSSDRSNFMEIHAASSSSAVDVSREEHGVPPLLQLPQWTTAECALQTRDDRLSIDGGGAQSDNSCCCSVTTCDGYQTFDSDSATTEQLLPLDGVGGGDPTAECGQGFGTLQVSLSQQYVVGSSRHTTE